MRNDDFNAPALGLTAVCQVAGAGLALLALGFAPLHATAQTAPASVSSSVLTVGNLIVLENAAVLKAAQRVRQDAGLNPAEPPKALVNAGAAAAAVINVEVMAILGTPDRLRAHLSVEGEQFDNAVPGTSVRGCVVETITPQCVSFSSVLPSSAAAATKPTRSKANAAQSSAAAPVLSCPQACWSGTRRVPLVVGNFGEALMTSGGAPGTPLPMPSPLVNAPPNGLQGPSRTAMPPGAGTAARAAELVAPGAR